MRFALLGDHPDGLAMIRALVATGRHSLIAYAGPAPGVESLRRLGLEVRATADVEEILADPAVEAVVVAGKPGDRAAQLRRALQSERHVLCVHPADQTPDSAYEAGMIQTDTKQVLLPLLPDALHPGVIQLANLLRAADSPLGAVRLIVLECASTGDVLIDAASPGHRPSLPGWSILRALVGEVVEVSAFAVREELVPGEPLLLAGRGGSGALISGLYLSGQAEPSCRVWVHGSNGRAGLTLPTTWPGDASLRLHGTSDQAWDWPGWDPWPSLVQAFEEAIARQPASGGRRPTEDTPNGSALASAGFLPPLAWQDEVRCLELDDAARRSVERRRASTLDFQEASEEVGFKGTMTLLGCAVLWGLLVLVVFGAWEPRLLWLVIPLLAVFLGLQLLRWVIPPPPPPGERVDR